MSSRVFVRRGRNNLRDERRGSWQGPVSVTQGIKGDDCNKVVNSATLSDTIARPFRFSTNSLHKTDNEFNVSYEGDSLSDTVYNTDRKTDKWNTTDIDNATNDVYSNKDSTNISTVYSNADNNKPSANKEKISNNIVVPEKETDIIRAGALNNSTETVDNKKTIEESASIDSFSKSPGTGGFKDNAFGNTESGIKESGIKESGFNESGTKEPGTNGFVANESGTNGSGIKESLIKESLIKESEVQESQAEGSGIKESKTKESGTREFETKESYTNENSIKESDPPQSDNIGYKNADNFSDIDLDELKVENASGQWVEYHTLRERIASFDFKDSAFLIKAFIAVFLVVTIVFFSFQCLILKNEYDRINDRLLALQSEFNDYKDSFTAIQDIADKQMPLSDNQEAVSVVSKNAPGNGIRYVYLTFDDGPSPYTDEILDILASYDVKATFFVCGKSGYDDMYKRIVDEGHTIGMHSFSHDYKLLYESLDSFQTDLHKIQNYIFDVTGVWTTYYRFPGGSSNTASQVPMSELIGYLDRNNITYFDWNVYGGDNIASDIIVSNVTSNISGHENCMILLHDAGDKEETVEALPKIIEYVQSLPNTVIVPVTESTVPVQHSKNQ